MPQIVSRVRLKIRHGVPAGIPRCALSKGRSSHHSGWNGQIQATRKGDAERGRRYPATVSDGEAIQVARGMPVPPPPGQIPSLNAIWVDDQQNGNLSWTFTLGPRAAGDPNVRKYWVAAVGEPRVLNWESEVYHTHNGVVSGNIWAASPFQATESRAFPSLEVSRLLPNEKAITNAEGRYGYTTPGASTEIRAKLRGPWFIVKSIRRWTGERPDRASGSTDQSSSGRQQRGSTGAGLRL